MALVTVGCRLPHGIVLEVGDKSFTVKGLNSSAIIGADHFTTEVDASLWNGWKAANKDSKLLSSGALFEAGSERDAKAKAKELKAEKTGFEKIEQDSNGVKAAE